MFVIPNRLTTPPGVTLQTDHSPLCRVTDWPLPLVSPYKLTTPPGVTLYFCFNFFIINSNCLYSLNWNKQINKWSDLCFYDSRKLFDVEGFGWSRDVTHWYALGGEMSEWCSLCTCKARLQRPIFVLMAHCYCDTNTVLVHSTWWSWGHLTIITTPDSRHFFRWWHLLLKQLWFHL